MKCIRCGTDSKYKDRSDGKCPGCSNRFAFEPKKGDRFTDAAFKAAIDAVSAQGQVRWGVEHLFYELCRRQARRSASMWHGVMRFAKIGLVVLLVAGALGLLSFVVTVMLLASGLGIWWWVRKVARSATVG